jgi:hypothetical protein
MLRIVTDLQFRCQVLALRKTLFKSTRKSSIELVGQRTIYSRKMMRPSEQAQFDFEAKQKGGLDAWHAERARQRKELARTLGLPLGEQVELWLHDGIRLRGELRLREDALLHANATQENTQFEISSVPFFYREIQSCVRL